MTKEEKEQFYKDYLESGLSPKEFAESHNVKPAVLKGLISFHKRINAGEKSTFIMVTTKSSEVPSKTISFKLDNHLIEIDTSLLKSFLGALHD